MTQRKAGIIANKIHRAYEARQISAPKAIQMLEDLDLHFVLSETQSRKLADLAHGYNHNRHMYDENGFWKD